MVVLSIAPIRIYNTSSNESKRPKRVLRRPVKVSDEVVQLRHQIVMYKHERAKLRKLAEWNLRSTKSSLKDVQDTLEILNDLYGDEMYEDHNGKDL